MIERKTKTLVLWNYLCQNSHLNSFKVSINKSLKYFYTILKSRKVFYIFFNFFVDIKNIYNIAPKIL